MKIKRLKGYKRLLDVYSQQFGLNLDPLEIFVDNTFACQALLNKLCIKDQFSSSLKIPVKLVTSSCVISECETLEELFHGTLNVLRQFKVLKCKHSFDPSKSAPWCIRKRIRTANKGTRCDGRSLLFGLASNDDSIQACARLVPGMPIFYVAHSRFNLEPAPVAVSEILLEKAQKSVVVTQQEGVVVKALEEQFGLRTEVEVRRRRKRPNAPNPLSCKKKTRKRTIGPTQHKLRSGVKKKHRKRSRIKNTWAFQQALSVVKAELGLK
ncbi:Small subunit processome component [Clonorchis sinensis]|uniref:Small subunit processome component n=1 Tax=Clonorchis sinensis TaxID=79923 RepID=A0A8T1MH68_CLOSI|nr:Small subunit processome component [Clonorchis sinensis]